LGYVARLGSQLSYYANPLLEELFERTGQIIYLAIPNSGKVLYLESLYHFVQQKIGYSIAGRTAPMHCTALGKADASKHASGRCENDHSLSWASGNDRIHHY